MRTQEGGVVGFKENREVRRAEKQRALAESTYVSALAAWQSEYDDIDTAFEFARNGGVAHLEGVQLRAGETVFAQVTGAALVEPRRGAGHWQGRSAGTSVRVMKGVSVRVGNTAGTYVQGTESPTMIDQGEFIVTNRRGVFHGSQQAREWSWDKLLGVNVDHRGIIIYLPVSNRQKVSGIGGDAATISTIASRISIAMAHHEGHAQELADSLAQQLAELERRKPSPPAIEETAETLQLAAARPTEHSAETQPTFPPAGWYGDPKKEARLRYWDGSQWTEHVAP